MHAADRAKILPFIEQRRINSSWGAILEAFFMEASQDASRSAGRSARAGRLRRGHRRSSSLTAIPVVRSTRHMERPTAALVPTSNVSWVTADIKISLPGAHRESHDPTAQRLFLDVDDDLRFAELFRQLANLSAQFLVFFRPWVMRGSRTRLRGFRASRMPAWRSRRQLVRCEEYKPSRRSSAPTPPGMAEAESASSRMPILYSVENVRRLGLATTSESASRRGAQR